MAFLDWMRTGLAVPAAVATATAAALHPLPARAEFRRTAALGGEPAKIAIVIDDLGLDPRRGARAVSLAAPLTLAYLPYGRDLTRQIEAAARGGHEILLHMPMEPLGSDDPGPDALSLGLPTTEIERRLQDAFARVPSAVGLNNHMGSKFTRDAAAMQAVFGYLHGRELMFLDSLTTGDSVGARLAVRNDVRHAVRDVFLDNVPRAAAIAARLSEVEDIARQHGQAVAIGHPHDATLDTLERWLHAFDDENFCLVPISTIARLRYVTADAVGPLRPKLRLNQPGQS
ncbi:MAG: divergent polysaccharide deacetylase family protein [Proteobacteria bacterium]|nr:divergent polysaccharide deacetylase family protein [Pseudomonadota bacterium]